MEKKMLWLGIMVVVVGLCSSGALAAVLGPPAAGLDAGQFRVGVDISSSQTGIDLKVEETARVSWKIKSPKDSGTEIGDLDKFRFDDAIQSEMMFANIGYGIVDKLEVYLLVGVSDLGFGDEADYHGLDQDFANSDELAYGFGVKGTIFEEDKLKFGALFQMTWASFDGDLDLDSVSVDREGTWDKEGFYENFYEVPGTYDIDYYQIKIAVGPTYKLTDTITIYGGPFYQLMDGNLDMERSRTYKDEWFDETFYDSATVSEDTSIDISERSRYGIYFGAQINCSENLPLCIECQTSNETYVVGASLAYKF
ncbi:MAG: hypothetical protein A2Z38_12555 [Planctomycetes bacterium RBG_19FT_COMBO_48_8]|nr:MAG: hypothetical protein A2Z38_12555 [Planctomycetes bacterium RBG_19FT_COMBO_48_8]